MSRMDRDKNKRSVTRQVNKMVKKRSTPPQPPAQNEEKVAVRDALFAALTNNEKLVVLASALATHALPDPANKLAELTREVASSYPARFFGLGALLEDLVPTAHDLISQGLKPLVLMGSTDLARSYAGVSALCAARSPVTFLMAAGPEEGQTWQAQGVNDLAILRTLPPLLIGVPSSPLELKRQLTAALQSENNPVALYYSSLDLPLPPPRLNLAAYAGIGKGQMLREGKDLAIVALGAAVGPALELAQDLVKFGHEAAVIDAAWLRPLDEPLLAAIANYFSRLITLETGSLTAGFGAALLEMIETKKLQGLWVHRISLEGQLTSDLTTLTERLATETNQFLEKALQQEGFSGPPFFPARPSEAT